MNDRPVPTPENPGVLDDTSPETLATDQEVQQRQAEIDGVTGETQEDLKKIVAELELKDAA